MKSKFIILITFILFFVTIGSAQEKQKLYFKLIKDHYSKSVLNMQAIIKTKREVTIYTFTLPCNCVRSGTLAFSGHNNPEAEFMSEPVRVMKKEELRRFDFIKFNSLIKILKETSSNFNNKYSLYFIEDSKPDYLLYHVRPKSDFGDDAIDILTLDSLGRQIP
jgi:hypothetical protein